MTSALDQAATDMMALRTNPVVLEAARRVHPTWVAANGHRNDPGVDGLAREIAQCVASLRYLRAQDTTRERPYAAGHGIIVTEGFGVEGFTVAVVAADVAEMRLDMAAQHPEAF